MKGYLQRLARQAIRPRSGIHPMVGSIYAGPVFAGLDGGVSDPGLTEEEQVMTNPQREPAELRITENRIRSAGEEARAGRFTAAEHEGRETAQSSTAFEPLVKRVDSTPIHAGRAERDSNARQLGSPAETDRLKGDSRSYVSLLPPEKQSPLVARSAHQHETPLRPTRGSSEAEPIQIHIGRIEVTAVPEVQRPAVARTRKSLELGEYLKRRDGTAG
jgi:hypothetical protein